MAKIDLDSLSIEELAALARQRHRKAAEKVAARRAELEAELEKLAQYGKPAQEVASARPPPRPRRAEESEGTARSRSPRRHSRTRAEAA